MATRRWDVPVSVDTRFDLASVTKLFTSVAVLALGGPAELFGDPDRGFPAAVRA